MEHDYTKTLKQATDTETDGKAERAEQYKFERERIYAALAVSSAMSFAALQNQNTSGIMQAEFAKELQFDVENDVDRSENITE